MTTEHDSPEYSEEDELLVEVIEDYIEDYGMWMLVTYPGVYDILKAAFVENVEAKRQLYKEMDEEIIEVELRRREP